MHRRTALGGIASIVTGTAGYALLTGTSEAATVDVGGYTIESKDVETPTPVQGVHMAVTGEYSYTTAANPTRVTLRLTVTFAGETQQLAAMAVPGELKSEQSGEIDLDVNLLDHERITAPMLTPSEVGDTKSLTFDSALTLTVSGNSGELGTETIRDSATIEVTKKPASVEATVSAAGAITVQTATP